MNQLFNLIKKELRELLTPSTLASVIVMMLVFIALGSFISSEVETQTSVQPFGYYDATSDGSESYSGTAIESLKLYYEQQDLDPDKYVVNLYGDIGPDFTDEKLKDAMTKNELTSAFYFPQDFNVMIKDQKIPVIQLYWNQTTTGIFSVINELSTTTGLAKLSSFISAQLILEHREVPPEVFAQVMSPVGAHSTTFFNGKAYENVTPDQITQALTKQNTFVPIIIMLIIVMIGSIVISSIGNEKENKTMETLLTLPTERTTIVAGKLLGSTIAGLVMGAFYMVGMYFYVSGLDIKINGSVSLDDLGLTLGFADWLIVVVFMFLAIICALGLCMILGAFAKNYKAAQMYVLPISVLAIIPMFITMFSSIGQLPAVLQGILFVIPFTHPMTIMQNLMFGNTSMIVAGLIYLIVFAGITIFATVKIYNSDILITGLVKKKNKKKAENAN